MSLSSIGTPRNGPSGSSPDASVRAASNRSRSTASSCGFTFSMRAMAASTSSAGLTSPRRTSSACSVASSHVVSVTIRNVAGQGSRAPSHLSTGPISGLCCHPRRITRPRPARRTSRARPAGEGRSASSRPRACWCRKCAHARQTATSGWPPSRTTPDSGRLRPQHQHATSAVTPRLSPEPAGDRHTAAALSTPREGAWACVDLVGGDDQPVIEGLAIAACGLLLVGAAFQLGLSAGAPWAAAAYGGRAARPDGRLPGRYRAASLVTAVVLIGIGGLLLLRGGVVGTASENSALTVACWVFAG